MKNCIYFVENSSGGGRRPALRPGFGFREDGSWRGRPLPAEADGVLVDDRYLPDRRGLETALRILGDWRGPIVLDLERPFSPLLGRLVQALSGADAVVPPAYAGLSNAPVLVGPWPGGGSFAAWMDRQRARYGAAVLDAAPLYCRAVPGGPWEGRTGPVPERGFPCPGAGCLHRRDRDGALWFWDTQETLAARCAAAGVPCIVFAADWEALLRSPDIR